MKMNIPNKRNIQTVNVIDYNSVTCVMICTAGPKSADLGSLCRGLQVVQERINLS